MGLLNVEADLVAEKTAVCEEVVKQMVIGANKLFDTDYAVAVSGFAGPGGPDGGRSGVIVGTIWVAVGTSDNIVTCKIEEDNGRDKNLSSATSLAMRMLRDFLKELRPKSEVEE
jgi:nicotinamide-nucleotide amidase